MTEHVNKPCLVKADYFVPGMYTLEVLGSRRSVTNIFSDLDIPVQILDEPSAIVPVKHVVLAYHEAASVLGTNDLGSKIARLIGIEDYGLIGRYATQAPTLLDALQRLFAIHPTQVCGVDVSFEVTDQVAVVKQRAKARRINSWHHVSNAEACQYVNLIRYFAGEDWTPLHVTADYARSRRSQAFEDFVGCKVEYARDAMSIAFPTEILQMRNPSLPDQTNVLTIADVQRLNNPSVPESTIRTLESLIHLRLMAGKTDREGLANMMGVGPRSLQRIIEGEGTTFRSLLAEARYQRARALLNETDLSVGQISDMLNYGYPEHFARAFKRWSGHSPNRYRASDNPSTQKPATRAMNQ